MEDVIVERTTVRSTTQNPKPKGGGPLIVGDNITIGTMIVNSPNARVDNSVHATMQSNTQTNSNLRGLAASDSPSNSKDNYNADRDFFKNAFKSVDKLVPALMMMYIK